METTAGELRKSNVSRVNATGGAGKSAKRRPPFNRYQRKTVLGLLVGDLPLGGGFLQIARHAGVSQRDALEIVRDELRDRGVA